MGSDWPRGVVAWEYVNMVEVFRGSYIIKAIGKGEFEIVMQTRDQVEGLHNCQEFSQPLSCLYQAMQTRKPFSIA